MSLQCAGPIAPQDRASRRRRQFLDPHFEIDIDANSLISPRAGLKRAWAGAAAGTSSSNTSTRFACSPEVQRLMPVMFPPARLPMRSMNQPSPSARSLRCTAGCEPIAPALNPAGRTRGDDGYLGAPQWGRSLQELDRSSLQPFLTLTDLHTYALTFRQLIQPTAAERRRVDENILSAAILRYETKSPLDVVPFN